MNTPALVCNTRPNERNRGIIKGHHCNLLLLLLLLFLPGASRAQQVLFSSGPHPNQTTFTTQYEFDNFFPQKFGAAFVPTGMALTGQFNLSQIDIYVLKDQNPLPPTAPPDPFCVELLTDSGGLPNRTGILETWCVDAPTDRVTTLQDATGVRLVAGHQYWVVVEPVANLENTNVLTDDVWVATQPTIGPIAIGLDGEPDNPSIRPAFDVLGTAVPLNPVVNHFLGLGFAQYLHLVAGPVTPPPGGPIELMLGFADLNGNPVGPSLTTLPLSAGQTASLDLNADSLITSLGQHVAVRPVISIVQSSAVPSVSATLMASAEVHDIVTGIGTVLVTSTLPGNAAPTFALQGLAGGETMQLTVMAHPPNPCLAVLSFADANGNPIGPSLPVNLSPGAAASLNLSASTLGLKLGQRTDIQPIVTIAPQTSAGTGAKSVCPAGAEVFDSLTGRTHTHQEGDTSALPAVQ